MRRKIVSCFLVASLLFCIGCSSSYEVSSSSNIDPSFDTFNVDAYDRSATIVFQDGRELDARNIVASPDSTRFLNEKTDAITVVPTHTIKKVVFTNRGIGFLEGFAWGALIGAATVLAVSAASPSQGHEFSGTEWTLFFMALGAGTGGVIGGIPGVIIGHSYEYQFVTSADTLK